MPNSRLVLPKHTTHSECKKKKKKMGLMWFEPRVVFGKDKVSRAEERVIETEVEL